MAIKIAGTEVISDDKRILNNESLPDIRPSLLLDFANSKTLDPRITFTRGSTATYWDGKTTAKAEENLFTYSQAIDQWDDYGVTVTADNTTAPDGTTTADKLAVTTTGTFRRRLRDLTLVSGNSYTFSFWVKGDTVTSCSFYIQHGTSTSATVLEGTATLGSTGTTILDVTGLSTSAWARIAVTYSITSSTLGPVSIYPGVAGSQTAGDSVFIWGAQLEQRSSATAYTATTSAPIVKYQPVLQTAASGAARFDHSPTTGESKGLLIEEARTNIAYPSHQQSGTSLSRVTRNTTGAIAPDGSQTASIVRETTETGAHHIYDSIVGETANTVYTASVYVKALEITKVSLRMRISDAGDVYKYGSYDLVNLTASEFNDSNYTGTITDVGNGWRRITLTGDVGDGTLDLRVHTFSIQAGTSNTTYEGNGWDGFGYWGLQVEAGSFPTSYIATAGSTVTRAVDSAIISGDSFADIFTQTGLCIYGEGLYSAPQGNGQDTVGLIGLDNSTTSEVLYIGVKSSNNTDRLQSRSNSSIDVDLSNSGAIDGTIKFSASLATDDVAFVRDGLSAATDSSFVLPKFTRLQIGYHQFGSAWNNTISKIAFYPKRLPNATLQAMTEE